MDNITILNKNLCTGCSLCANICPFDAIEMTENDEGFLFPFVNEKCTGCGLCAKNCPQLAQKSQYHESSECYAVVCKDEYRDNCSSGGVFGAIANYMIDNGGVVYGAAFNEDYKGVSHIAVDKKQDIDKILRSKYVQSDLGDCFREIKERLVSTEEHILFSGCPCQVDALKIYLGKDYTRLTTIDILCHGVPSPLAYRKFLEEVSGNGNKTIIGVNFRDKKYGWGTLISVKFADGSTHYDYYNGHYFRAFLSGLSMREGCNNCKYAQSKRVGDLTLGDFWGIKNHNQQLDDGKGTSMVICNTEKGRKILNSVFKEIVKKEEISMDKTIEISKKTNGALIRPTWYHKMRNCFFNHLKKDSFSKSVQYAETSLIDVGILGWWIETARSNYGSTLTCYALYQYVLSLGLSAALVSPPNFDRKYAGEFNIKHGYRMTAKYSVAEMKENNKYIDTYIVGSDVLWYYDAFISSGYFFLLDFASADKKKISYATSFGNTAGFFPDNELVKAKILMNRFDHIGVRELEGVEVCSNRFNIQATQVLDPVFICDKSNWVNLAKLALRKTKKKFLFAYMLDPTLEKAELLKWTSRELGLELICITDKQFDYQNKASILQNYGLLDNATIEELIYHMMNAEFVITDSYHGLCFSIIFERAFLTIVNRTRGASRFETLASLFNIGDRMVENLCIIKENLHLYKQMDYNKIKESIKKEIVRSREWLDNALNSKKKIKAASEADVFLDELLVMSNEIEVLKNQLKDIDKKSSEK